MSGHAPEPGQVLAARRKLLRQLLDQARRRSRDVPAVDPDALDGEALLCEIRKLMAVDENKAAGDVRNLDPHDPTAYRVQK